MGIPLGWRDAPFISLQVLLCSLADLTRTIKTDQAVNDAFELD